MIYSKSLTKIICIKVKKYCWILKINKRGVDLDQSTWITRSAALKVVEAIVTSFGNINGKRADMFPPYCVLIQLLEHQRANFPFIR